MRYITRLLQRTTRPAALKHYSNRPAIPVDSLCIPLSPPYSLASYLPTNPTPLSRETLLHLHRLSALEPPTTEAEWKELEDLGPLAAIIEGIRGADLGAGKEGEMVDARVRGQASELESVDQSARRREEQDDPAFGRSLLKLAQVTEGAYYTAPTPSNVRGKKRAGSGAKGEAQEQD